MLFRSGKREELEEKDGKESGKANGLCGVHLTVFLVLALLHALRVYGEAFFFFAKKKCFYFENLIYKCFFFFEK